MTVINKRLESVFDGFCRKYCKHRTKKKCGETLKKAGLILCPIVEWWDLNDYLNDVRRAVDKIQDVLPPKM